MSKNIFDQFGTDADLEAEGVILDYGTDRITVRPASTNNDRYVSVLEAQSKPYRRAMDMGTIDQGVSMNILYTTYAMAIVTKWETCTGGKEFDKDHDGNDTRKWAAGITNPNGDKPTPFNVSNVVNTFARLPKLFLDVKAEVEGVSLFQKDTQDTDVKNLPGS